MTLLQNQTLEAPVNVLHDQGIPNTLARMSVPVPVGAMHLPVGAFVATVATVVVVLSLVVARLA